MANIINQSMSKFLCKNGLFRIPIYQRKYTWKANDCITLINDFYENFINFKKDESKVCDYYIGTTILKQVNSGDLIIIDGQQRLTTSVIIFSAIKYILNEKELDIENYDEKRNKSIDTIDESIFCKNNKSIENKIKIHDRKRSNTLQKILESQIDKLNDDEKKKFIILIF